MSELKARLLGQTMNEYGCDTKIYIKSEADKVIAELQNESDVYKAKYEQEYDIAVHNEKQLSVMRIGIRHQKHKRCLAMARWCASRSASWILDPADDELNKSDFYDKWKLRWLELAEKFKEAK